jgi:hypothetical protein
MAIADDIRAYLSGQGAKVSGKGDAGEAVAVLAEQKSFLSKKKVEYKARFKVIEAERVVRFFEMLAESGSGMGGSDFDQAGGGWSFKTETYKTGGGGRSGSITEQGSLLGKKYSFTLDYAKIRNDIEALATSRGYRFEYQITPKGL